MAHAIFGNRFISRVVPAWHGLGITFPAGERILPSEAVERVAGGVKFDQVPLVYNLDGKQYESKGRVVLRLPTQEDPNPHELGITTDRWIPQPYPVLAKAMDRIDPDVYKVETAGLIEEGGLCFFSLRGEDWKLLGIDEMKTYILVNLSHTPGIGHRASHVTVRTVCKNTNEAAIASSQIDLRIQHGADAAQQIGLAGDLITRFRKAQEETKRIFETFARTPAPQEAVDRILAAAFPDPIMPPKLRLLKGVTGGDAAGTEVLKDALTAEALELIVQDQERHEKAIERVVKLRDAGMERYRAFRPDQLRGTVWAAYNAATEVSDWRGDGKTVPESILRGSRRAEKVRAFGAAAEICGIN